MLFIPNMGQADADVQMQAVGLDSAITFHTNSVELGASLHLQFVGANARTRVHGNRALGGKFNYLHGADPSRWQTQVPTFGGLVYEALYEGIDLHYEGRAGQLKSTYMLQPGANSTAIRWRYDGATHVTLNANTGDVQIGLPNGQAMTEHAPVAWQTVNGQQQPVEVRFVVHENEVSFAVGAFDVTRPLVIDPSLVLGSYAGGSGSDTAHGVSVDGAGNVYVVGETSSSNFLGGNVPTAGSSDVIILKLNPTATDLIYGTLIGGKDVDKGIAVVVNSADEAYITVDTFSKDFPIKNALYPAPLPSNEAVLVKLTADGDLAYSTWLPMSFPTSPGRNVAVDSKRNVIVAGELYSPTIRARDLLVLKLNPLGNTLLWAVNGQDDKVGDAGNAVAIGPNDAVYVAGSVDGSFSDLKVTENALQKQCGRRKALGDIRDCDEDALVAIISADGVKQYVSYWGGNGADNATGIAVSPDGSFVVAGNTFASDFVTTTGALMPVCQADPSTNACYYDTFVTQFTPNAGAVAWSTYLASDERGVQDFAKGAAMDEQGKRLCDGLHGWHKVPNQRRGAR